MRLGALLLLLLPKLALAQVNTEKLRNERREAGFSGNLNASFSLSRGNLNLLRVGSGVRLQYETLRSDTASTAPPVTEQLVFLVADVAFGEQSKDGVRSVILNAGFLHARWTAMWWPRLGSEVFGQVQYNEFIRLSSRLLGGAGARLAIVETPALSIYAGAGYMFEEERLDLGRDAPVSELNHRSTNYLAFVLNLLDGAIALSNTAYVQPNLERWSDYRVISEGLLSIKVSERFGVEIGLTARYDNDPPVGPFPALERLDLSVTNGVRLAF